ncbi:MAG: CBS domain-containing protein [Pirellulales bacterium]
MSVGRICVREVDTATPDESVAVIAQRMHQRAVGTLIIVNQACRVTGIVSDRDLVSRVIAKGLDPGGTAVHEVMTIAPKTILEDASIESALLIMRTGKFRRLPIVDRGNRLIGLITLDDILMHLSDDFAQIGRLLKRETPRAVVEGQHAFTTTRLRTDARLAVAD